jgi:hypothetical protein
MKKAVNTASPMMKEEKARSLTPAPATEEQKAPEAQPAA